MPADTDVAARSGFRETLRSIARRLWRPVHDRLPTRITRYVRVMAWISLSVQIGIVGTGGLVRLTGSGLGCPTWPRCTEDSFVAVPEMGLHGAIEFGNRVLTFVLVAVAILMFLAVVRMRAERRDLFWLSFAVAMYVPVQAILGGITVLTQLNPYVVGLHYFASVPLVGLAAVLVHRVYAVPGPRVRAVPAWYAVVTHLMTFAMLFTVVVGILTTGAGPHAGDSGAARNGLDPELMYHVHSWPAYALFALTAVLVVGGRRLPTRPWAVLLLAVEVVQIVVGVWQARTHVEHIWMVNVHMVLAVVLVAAAVAVVLHLKRPVQTPSA